MSRPRSAVFVAISVLVSGCAESSFREDIADISRSSVLQVALLAQEVLKDETCGFEAPAVEEAVELEGEVGEMGRAIYRVERCELGFDAVERVIESCGREPIRLTGRTIVSATLIVEGVVTGRADPIIPAGPDAVSVSLDDVVLDGFRARFDSNAASLVMREGSLSAEVRPRLARAEDTAFCSIPTGDTEVRRLVYDGASLLASNEDAEALVFVSSSDLAGQIGQGPGGENVMSGSMRVGGQTIVFDAEPLDEKYDRAEFEEGFTCEEDIALPVDYACECVGDRCHPDAPVADGLARMLPFLFGNVTALIEEDERCGFSSGLSPVYDAAIGTQGSATWSLDNACTLRFETALRRDEDCNGTATFVQGTVSVTGTKVARGYLTGDLEGEAVVPTTMDALDYALHFELEDFTIWTSGDEPSLYVQSGTLGGAMRPVLAFDPDELACITPTPNSVFAGLELSNANVRITDGDESFALAVEGSNVDAVAGAADGRENTMVGVLRTSAVSFEVPSDGAGLDPDYDREAFVAGFSCEPNVTWPTEPAQCSFRQRLGPDVARAAALLMTTATTRVVTDDVCGVASATATVSAGADVGAEGLVTTDVDSCTIVETGVEAVADDCYRTRTFAEGTVSMTGTRDASGRVVRDAGRTTVEPLARLAYEDRFEARFDDFRVWSLERDTMTPLVDVHFVGGNGRIELVPVMGENETTTGVFDIPTPIARVPSLTIAGVDAVVGSAGRYFEVRIDDAMLELSSGMYEGRGNTLSGYVVIDGERVEIAPGTTLDEEYDQTELDGSYACTPDLLEPVPPN